MHQMNGFPVIVRMMYQSKKNGMLKSIIRDLNKECIIVLAINVRHASILNRWKLIVVVVDVHVTMAILQQDTINLKLNVLLLLFYRNCRGEKLFSIGLLHHLCESSPWKECINLTKIISTNKSKKNSKLFFTPYTKS